MPIWGHQHGQLVEVAHGPARHLGADLGLVDIAQAADGEPSGGQSSVVGQGPTEVAGTDDHDRPLLVETQLDADLEHEVLDVVADAAGAG